MKKAFLISLCAIALYACTDEDILFQQERVNHSITDDTSPGRLIFSNKESLNDAINLLKQGYPLEMLSTRSSDEKAQISSGTTFRSLYEANKQAYFASLTPEEISIIENDEDGLEYCLPDSIVADFYFSQLLNEDRIVQIGDSVYKFYRNGIAVTHEDDADSLNNYNYAEFPGVNVGTNEDGMWSMHVTPEIDFIVPGTDETPVLPNYGNASGEIKLENGVTIPEQNIRDVNYWSNGDGSWIHNFFNGLFGRNILAINKFEDKKRMVLSLYDLNYYVYAHIGTEVRMQKKVLGIWWNTKAQEIRSGWTVIEIKHKHPNYIINYMPYNPFTQPVTYTPELPDFMKRNFPFQDEEVVLLELPFDTEITTQNVNEAFKAGLETALHKASGWLKQYINSLNENQVGTYTAHENTLYSICGANEKVNYNKRSMRNDFYTDNIPLEIIIGFSYGDNGFHLSNLTLNKVVSASLNRGVVYGAVKYNGRWLGARISKDQ